MKTQWYVCLSRGWWIVDGGGDKDILKTLTDSFIKYVDDKNCINVLKIRYYNMTFTYTRKEDYQRLIK